MCFDSLDGRKAVHGRGVRSCAVPAQAQPVLADFGRRSVHCEAFDRRAHRCKSSAVPINLFGAVPTALRQAKAAEQNGLSSGAQRKLPSVTGG
jgi:hypothetical protein